MVKEGPWGMSYFGPYSTLSAARGKRTTEQRYAHRWESREVKVWVERTAEGWEKVED